MPLELVVVVAEPTCATPSPDEPLQAEASRPTAPTAASAVASSPALAHNSPLVPALGDLVIRLLLGPRTSDQWNGDLSRLYEDGGCTAVTECGAPGPSLRRRGARPVWPDGWPRRATSVQWQSALPLQAMTAVDEERIGSEPVPNRSA
jgi:hypothetical protein